MWNSSCKMLQLCSGSGALDHGSCAEDTLGKCCTKSQSRLLGPVQMVGVLHHSFALSGSSRSRGGTGGFGHRIDSQDFDMT